MRRISLGSFYIPIIPPVKGGGSSRIIRIPSTLLSPNMASARQAQYDIPKKWLVQVKARMQSCTRPLASGLLRGRVAPGNLGAALQDTAVSVHGMLDFLPAKKKNLVGELSVGHPPLILKLVLSRNGRIYDAEASCFLQNFISGVSECHVLKNAS